MSAREKDEHDEASERLLPCLLTFCTPDQDDLGYHNSRCPAYYRPAVADALRAQAAAHKGEVEKWKFSATFSACAKTSDYERLPDSVIECHDRIEALEAKLAQAEKVAENLRRIHNDPPPHIQELVIAKLDLVSRDAVVAAHKAEVERLRRDSAEQYSAMFIGKDKVITTLRERLAHAERQAEQNLTMWGEAKAEITDLRCELAAAYIAGLEWTLNNCAGLSPSDVDLLKAEIEKCRK